MDPAHLERTLRDLALAAGAEIMAHRAAGVSVERKSDRSPVTEADRAADALIHPLKIDQPVATFAMLLLAWFTGAAIGMVFMGFSPWAPTLVGLVNKGYVRISMFASGKMFVANMLPSQMRALFDWHPLFHIVDQARGFAFINYVPHFTAIGYPVRLALVCLAIGLLGEFYTRRRVSLSWSARGLGQ